MDSWGAWFLVAGVIGIWAVAFEARQIVRHLEVVIKELQRVQNR